MTEMVLTFRPEESAATSEGWSDPDIASDSRARFFSVALGEIELGRVGARRHARDESHPLEALYISFDSDLRSNLIKAGTSLLDLLVSHLHAGLAARVERDLELFESLKSSGMRWCDGSRDGALRVLEYRPRVQMGETVDRSASNEPTVRPLIFLATGSQVKWAQYEYLFRSVGLDLQWSKLSQVVSEPQVEGAGEIAEQVLVEGPLKQLARFAAKDRTYPIVLEDTMLFVEHFNRDFLHEPLLPGPDTKRWWAALGSDGLLEQMKGSTRRRAVYVAQLGVLDEDQNYRVYRSETWGRIASEERAEKVALENQPYTNPHNFHSIFVPEGSDKTFAEMMPGEFRAFDYRSRCVDLAAADLTQMAGARRSLQLGFELEASD